MNNGPGRHVSLDKASNFKKTMRTLFNYLKKFKYKILIVIIFALLASVFNIIGPKLLGNVTTEIYNGLINQIQGIGEGINFEYIRNIILTLLGLYGLASLFNYLQGFIMSKVATDTSYSLRKEVAEKVNKLPLSYFDKTTQGEVLSRVTNDIDTLTMSLNQSLTQIITSTATVLGVLVMMLSISVTMTLVALLIIPASIVLMMTFMKKAQRYFKERQENLGKANGHIEEMYSGHMVIKSFNREEKTIKDFAKYNKDLYDSSWKAQFFSSLMMPVMMIVGNLGYVLIAILGGYLAINGKVSIGDIQAFIQYVRNFTQPLSQLAQSSNVLQQTAAAAERVFEFLEEEEILKEKNLIKDKLNLKGDVEFKNVSFSYDGKKTIINDFSCKIKKGSKVAIVGPTGAGKTTIVKLLMRFYDIDNGDILIDKKSIERYKREELRREIGMVLQDTWLYNASIMENIRYGDLKATEEEIIDAAKKAHVDTFVHMLPNGYNNLLNEEASNISQGQKQLITIARAILAEPKILIFDEATSSVDTRTEVAIQKAMENLMKDKTSFIIAHRLSTIKNSDLILVMNDGDIVEKGTHNELLKKNGFYADLYNSQFEE